MTQLTLFLAISLVVVPGLVAGEETYDEPLVATDAFRQAWEALDWERAFFVLRPSEFSANSHPADLMFLAGMYTDDEIPNLGTKRQRALKFWELSERAALTGYEPAVIVLVNAFGWGDEILGYESDTEVSGCLNGIIGKRAYVSPDKDWLDTTMVKECLLLKSSPAIGTYNDSDPSQ
jgi:hypothetical protein